MTGRRRRAALAAAALRRQRARRVEVPSAHGPEWPLRVARSVLEISEQFGFGAPLGEEYAATGWHRQFADRAQDFESGTIYLDTATGHAGFWRWRDPIASSTPGSPECPASDGRVGSSARKVSG